MSMKKPLTVIFISITIMISTFALLGYVFISSHFSEQRNEIVNTILANISHSLQTHDQRLVTLLHNLNITDDD